MPAKLVQGMCGADVALSQTNTYTDTQTHRHTDTHIVTHNTETRLCVLCPSSHLQEFVVKGRRCVEGLDGVFEASSGLKRQAPVVVRLHEPGAFLQRLLQRFQAFVVAVEVAVRKERRRGGGANG